MKKIILHFHTGRGGRYHNGGHTSFCGEKTILEVLQRADNRGQWTFIDPANIAEIMQKIGDRPNIAELFEKCREANEYSEFERRTGIIVEELAYVDINRRPVITVAEAEEGTGCLNWDNEYDTDICIELKDCGEADLQMIIDSNEWNKEGLVKQWFDEQTDLNMNWKDFNGDYTGLVDSWFNFPTTFAADFYENETA